MSKYQQQVVRGLVYAGCEKCGFSAFELTREGQLTVALYHLNDLIDEVGEETPTGRMWVRWEGRIERLLAA